MRGVVHTSHSAHEEAEDHDMFLAEPWTPVAAGMCGEGNFSCTLKTLTLFGKYPL